MPRKRPIARMARPGAVYRPPEVQQREQDRGSAAKRGYGRRWRATRLGFLRKHPLCCQCEQRGLIVPATVVDHIQAHKGDRALFWDRSNWQPLCKPCHDRKTAGERGGWTP